LADISESFGEVAGVIRTMLGLTRHSRLRDQIRGTVELYALTSTHPELSKSSSDLAKVLEHQTGRLLEAATGRKRQWNWAALVFCWFVAAVCGYGCYLIWTQLPSWWGYLIFTIPALIGFLLFIAGIGTFIQQVEDET
jgi:hypothetical protein